MTESQNTLKSVDKKKIPLYAYSILLYVGQIVLFFILLSIDSTESFKSKIAGSIGISTIVLLIEFIVVSLYRIYNSIGVDSGIQMGDCNEVLSMISEEARKAEDEYCSALEMQLKKLKEEEMNLL